MLNESVESFRAVHVLVYSIICLFHIFGRKSLPRFDLEILLLLPIIELLQQFEDYAKGIASKKGKNVIIRK
jgi:hypothetical protein